MRPARLAAALLIAVLFAGCWNDLSRPGIDVRVETGYNQEEILIPFFAWGDRNRARVSWRLDRFDPGTGWVVYDERETQTPNGYGGILTLGFLDEGRYRLEASLLATRDRSYEPVPHRANTYEFWVDRTAPVFSSRWQVLGPVDDTGVALPGGPPPGPYDGTQAGFLQFNPIGSPNLDIEAPEVLLVVRAVSGDPDRPVRPPVPGQDEFDPAEHGSRPQIWGADEFPVATVVTIIMVVIDAAGNRSDTFFEQYEVVP